MGHVTSFDPGVPSAPVAARHSTSPGTALAACSLLGFFRSITLDALVVNVALPRESGFDLGRRAMTGCSGLVDGYTLMFRRAPCLSAGVAVGPDRCPPRIRHRSGPCFGRRLCRLRPSPRTLVALVAARLVPGRRAPL